MVKRQNFVKVFLSCAIAAIFLSGMFLSIDFRKSKSFAQVEAAEVSAPGGILCSNAVDADLILQKESEFLVDRNGNFTGFSEDAKERIESASTFSVIIPANVKVLGNYTSSLSSPFYTYGTKLLSVEFAPGSEIYSIGNFSFSGCSGLTSVNIPDDVTTIGSFAFSGCSNLTNINIPENIISVDDHAFYNCSSLTSVDIKFQNIDEGTFSGCSGLTSVNISKSVRSIGNSAFYGCSALKTVEINLNSNLKSIGSSAFYGCSDLTNITIPKEVTSIGSSAFYGCSGLTSIKVAGENLKYKDYNSDVIVDISSMTLILGCANSTIPEEVTSIGSSAFYNCSDLTNIHIPEKVTSIDSSAFSGCSGLTSITVASENLKYKDYNSDVIVDVSSMTLILGCVNSTIPEEVTSIGSSAFCGCSGLTKITIPDNVTSIGYNAFSGCSSLTRINIPDKVTSIDSNAFDGCENAIIIAGSKERATLFQNNNDFNLTKYKDQITYSVEIQFKNGLKTITQKKLYKQDVAWCLQDNGEWEQVADYQLPDLNKGYWQDEENNKVTLEVLNAKLLNGEIKDVYILNFVEQGSQSSLLWILIGASGAVLILAATLVTFVALHKKKKNKNKAP